MALVKVILENNNGLGREEKLAKEWAESQGYEVILSTAKRLQRKKDVLTKYTIPVGSVDFVRAALQQFGKELPDHIPYPQILSSMFHRKIWHVESLWKAKQMVDVGRTLFIKPADGWKRFTGFVASTGDDYRFNGVSSRIGVWVSEPVNFISEWRAYVVDHRLLALKHCDFGGAREVEPNLAVIHCAIDLLATDDAPSGYVMDFGVLENGETALVEVNDGFSFGAYDEISANDYMAVTQTRWYEWMLEPVPVKDKSVFIDLLMPRGGEDGVIVATRSDGAKVEFRGRPYSMWEEGEDTPMYRLHACLVRVNISALHCSEVENVSAWHEEWSDVNQMFEEALGSVNHEE